MRELSEKTTLKRIREILQNVKNYMDAYGVYYTIQNSFSRSYSNWRIELSGKIDGSYFSGIYLEDTGYKWLYNQLLKLQEDGLLTKKVDDTIEWMHNRIQELRMERMQRMQNENA